MKGVIKDKIKLIRLYHGKEEKGKRRGIRMGNHCIISSLPRLIVMRSALTK